MRDWIATGCLVAAMVSLAFEASAYEVRFETKQVLASDERVEACTASGCAPVAQLVVRAVSPGKRWTNAQVYAGTTAPTTPGEVAWVEVIGPGGRTAAENKGLAVWTCPHDHNGDGVVGAPDLQILLQRWRDGSPAQLLEVLALFHVWGTRCE